MPPDDVEREFEGQGYGAFKQAVGEAVAELLAPVRERYRELRADEAALERTLRAGRRARPRDRRADHGGGTCRHGAGPTLKHRSVAGLPATSRTTVRTPR